MVLHILLTLSKVLMGVLYIRSAGFNADVTRRRNCCLTKLSVVLIKANRPGQESCWLVVDTVTSNAKRTRLLKEHIVQAVVGRVHASSVAYAI